MKGLFGMPLAPFAAMQRKMPHEQAPMPTQPTPAGDKPYLQTTSGKLSAIGDLLLRVSGRGGNPILGYKLQQEQFNRAQQMREQSQQAALRNQMQLYDYKLQNPAPQKQDSYERALAAQGVTPGSPQYVEAMRQRQEALLRDPNSRETMFNIPGFGTFFGTIEQAQQLLSQRGAGSPPIRPVGPLTPLD